MLDEKSIHALELIAQAPDGLPFDSLGIDNLLFMNLLDEGVIVEPEGEYINTAFDRFPCHQGNAYLTPAGKTVVEQIRDYRRELEEIAKEKAQKEAEEKKQKKRDRLHDLFLILLGAALTFVAENFPKILHYFTLGR